MIVFISYNLEKNVNVFFPIISELNIENKSETQFPQSE